MNNSPINSTINSTTVVELADASSLNQKMHQWSNSQWGKTIDF